jgi:hypothetical protein
MIKTEYHQFFTSIVLSENNKDEEVAFLEDFLYTIPALLSNESADPYVDKDRIISDVNKKYGSSFELQDFGELHLFGELNESNSCFDFYGSEWDNIGNIRHLALTIQAYLRKFNHNGFHGVECYDEDKRESFAIFISSENIETVSMKDIIEERRKNHDLRIYSR